ncbi:MAG: TetR/AcrR family transcriptional regulator [Ilumatobacteraceae bacterium]
MTEVGDVPRPDPVPVGRGGQTRERIMVAGSRLFAEHGYDATTVETVALAAGIAAPSIYKHFPTKHAVLLAVTDRATRTSQARRSLNGPGDLPSQLADLFDEYMAEGQTQRRRLSIELSRAAFRSDEVGAALADYNADLRDALADTIRQATPAAAAIDRAEAAMLAHLLLVLLMGAVHLDTLDADRIGDQRLVAFLRERFRVLLESDPPKVSRGRRTTGSASVEHDEPDPTDGRRARTVRTKRRILDGAAEMFALHGYDGTSTEMIATSAGITVPGMYRHVNSKEELLVEVARRAFDGYRLVRPLDNGRGLGIGADLADLLSAFASSGDRVGRRLAIELDFGAWRSPALAEALRTFHRDVRANVARTLLAEGLAADEEQADLAAMVVLMLFMGTAHLDTFDPTLLDNPAWMGCLRRRVPQLIGGVAPPTSEGTSC